jgi:hypothetical protein
MARSVGLALPRVCRKGQGKIPSEAGIHGRFPLQLPSCLRASGWEIVAFRLFGPRAPGPFPKFRAFGIPAQVYFVSVAA